MIKLKMLWLPTLNVELPITNSQLRMTNDQGPRTKDQLTDPFQPTWGRGLLAVAVAAIGFLLPQAVPLEYCSLNNPSLGLNYLEITCAANVNGQTNVYLDHGQGFNELEKIRWPMGPSQSAYTYTFPLPDAPLLNLRLDPFDNGAGEFTITNFRIINRRGEEIHRFTKEDFQPTHQIDAITPTSDGWKLVVKAPADDPYSQVRLSGPIIPQGMNERNLKRCLISSGYLALMLWILLLAVYFALRLHRDGRAIARAVVFLAFVAVLFSLVGNRGLIKNSIGYAQYVKRQ
jgi:hypothetical protein